MRKLSNYTGILIGKVIVFETPSGRESTVEIDRVTCLAMKWNNTQWHLESIHTAIYPECPGSEPIKPEQIVRILDVTEINQCDPSIPEKPKYPIGTRLLYDAGDGPQIGHVSSIEIFVDARGAHESFNIAECPDSEGLTEKWILEVLPESKKETA